MVSQQRLDYIPLCINIIGCNQMTNAHSEAYMIRAEG
jgi:hypothetical protein